MIQIKDVFQIVATGLQFSTEEYMDTAGHFLPAARMVLLNLVLVAGTLSPPDLPICFQVARDFSPTSAL